MEKLNTKRNDKEVLVRLKSGDETAFEYLYWKYNSYVYNFIHSIIYDSSLTEDLTQNVFLKIWEKRTSIDPEQGFSNYLFTIARHYAYKETEKRMKLVFSPTVSNDELGTPDTRTEEKIDTASLQEYIDTLIEELPASRKEIFKLSRQQHLTNKEIALRLSISEKTVENQITNTLRFLKEKLSEDRALGMIFLLLANSL